jgi:hypothetical protein
LVVDLTGATDWCPEVRRLVTNDADADAAARRLRDATALDSILTLAATAATPIASVPPPAAVPAEAPRPACEASPTGTGERPRMEEAVRLAGEVRAHPLSRVYDFVRRLARNGRA